MKSAGPRLTSIWASTNLVVLTVTIAGGAVVALAKLLGYSNPVIFGLSVIVILANVAVKLEKDLLGPRRKQRRDKQAALAACLKWGSRVERVDDLDRSRLPYELGVFESSIAESAVPGEALPPYVARNRADRAISDALATKKAGIILVTGPTKAGKSRTAFEALGRHCSARNLLAPKYPNPHGAGEAPQRPLASLASLDTLPARRSEGWVLWLDRIDRHFRNGNLTRQVFDRLLQKYPGLVTLATTTVVPSRNSDDPADIEFLELLTRPDSVQVNILSRLEDDEAQQFRELYPGLADETKFVMGLGEALSATDQLLERLEQGDATCPEGVAIMEAAIDWRRATGQHVLRLSTLRDLTALYLPYPQEDLELAATFEQGFTWANDQIVSSARLLQQDNGQIEVFDFVYEHVASKDTPIREVAWRFVLNHTVPGEKLEVGVRAYSCREDGIAEEALNSAIEAEQVDWPLASYFLGVVLRDRGQPEAAMAAFRRAIVSGDRRAAFISAHRLSELIARPFVEMPAHSVHETMHYGAVPRDEPAVRALVDRYNEATKDNGADLPSLAFQVGKVYERSGQYLRAMELYTSAWSGGALFANIRLGSVLAQLGEHAAAKLLLQEAIESDDLDATPRGWLLMGTLLHAEFDLDGALEAYGEAIATGHYYAYSEAAYRAGWLWVGVFNRALATQSFEIASGSDDPQFAEAASAGLGQQAKISEEAERAIPEIESMLADRQRMLGHDDPDTLNYRKRLADTRWAAGQIQRAIPLFESTLAVRVRVLGRDDPDTLVSCENLALAYWDTGRQAEAIATIETAVESAFRTGSSDSEAFHRLSANLTRMRLASE